MCGSSLRQVCPLVAAAFLSVVRRADVAIQNAGGCRGSIEGGPFTLNDAHDELPFANTIVALTMSGAQIKAVLEDALHAVFSKGSTGPVSAAGSQPASLAPSEP